MRQTEMSPAVEAWCSYRSSTAADWGPDGTAVVESLALGTPGVGLAAGCLPELVEHGRTGWLAGSVAELGGLVADAGRIDPRECAREAAGRFTPTVMAARYAGLCEKVLAGTPARAPAGGARRSPAGFAASG